MRVGGARRASEALRRHRAKPPPTLSQSARPPPPRAAAASPPRRPCCSSTSPSQSAAPASPAGCTASSSPCHPRRGHRSQRTLASLSSRRAALALSPPCIIVASVAPSPPPHGFILVRRRGDKPFVPSALPSPSFCAVRLPTPRVSSACRLTGAWSRSSRRSGQRSSSTPPSPGRRESRTQRRNEPSEASHTHRAELTPLPPALRSASSLLPSDRPPRSRGRLRRALPSSRRRRARRRQRRPPAHCLRVPGMGLLRREERRRRRGAAAQLRDEPAGGRRGGGEATVGAGPGAPQRQLAARSCPHPRSPRSSFARFTSQFDSRAGPTARHPPPQGCSAHSVYHVALMPCYDKKLEASREQLRLPASAATPAAPADGSAGVSGESADRVPGTDLVLTTGEVREKAPRVPASLPASLVSEREPKCEGRRPADRAALNGSEL